MNEKSALYDPSRGFYKKPFGAIVSGTRLRIRLLIDKGIVVRDAFVVMKYDRHEAPATYRLRPVEGTEASRAFRMPHIRDARDEKNAQDGSGYYVYQTDFNVFDTGLYWYRFEITTDLGSFRVGRGPDGKSVIAESPEPFQLTVFSRKYREPSWIYGGVFYHIFVDRFNRSASRRRVSIDGKVNRDDWGGTPEYRMKDGRIWNNDFFGGDLRGITEKLDYLEDLGVTCLYLSPIFEAYSNHKYDTGDYMKIDPMFGDEEDFRDLCSEARKRGINVILDGVFAHTGSDSLYFNKYGHYGSGGAWNDPGSPYRSWYYIHRDGSYETWWGIDTLPRLNKTDRGYRNFLMGEDGPLRHWIRAGAHGWRLDVADELPPDFIEELSGAVHAERSDSLIIGEVWEDASNKVAYGTRQNYFEGNRIDSVMDYPVKDAVIAFIRDGNAERLAWTVEQICENYPAWAVDSLMNVLGTHDTERILTMLAGKRLDQSATRDEMAAVHMTQDERERGREMLKAAVLLQMTLPGVPCVYYGDEALMEGYKDPFNRRCFPWDDIDEETHDWYRKLIRIRKEHEVYRRGSFHVIAAHDGAFAFSRYAGDEGTRAMITAVNRGSEDLVLKADGTATDLLSGRKFENDITIAPGAMMLLEDQEMN